MVTIEMCVGFILAIVLTAVLVGASLLGIAQATASEASAQLARQAARGDEAMLQEARARVPESATVELERQSDGVLAVVELPVRLLRLGTVNVRAEAWAAYEPGEGP
ncbi:MAG: TadE family type IV pilus minor pilin [Propionibacteriaceae bacterium]|nr:TadE family type IV pilus minor pilin [Propionibacteriaceae bacterium]